MTFSNKSSAAGTFTGFCFSVTHRIDFDFVCIAHTASVISAIFDAALYLHFGGLVMTHLAHHLSFVHIYYLHLIIFNPVFAFHSVSSMEEKYFEG